MLAKLLVLSSRLTPSKIVYYTAAVWKWHVYLKIVEKTIAGEAKINELMKEFAADPALKPHIKDIAPMVPKVVKVLTKVSGDRKVNMTKIGLVNEKDIIAGAAAFYKDRFNAEIQVYSESDAERFDPKGRAGMAMPYQPAIYIE